jgi:hypothetical protein
MSSTLQIVIPSDNPLVRHLERRAIRRGLGDRRKPTVLRRRLPQLARDLLAERLAELEETGDSREIRGEATGP